MTNVIEQIQAYDIPHTSYMQAIRYMRERYDNLSREQIILMIENLTGLILPMDMSEESTIRGYFVLLYVVQEAIRMSKHTVNVDTLAVYTLAVEKSDKYIKENPWVFAKPEEEEHVDPLSGKVKMKKGKKQEMAAELYQQFKEEGKDKVIEVFQEELDMSKAGARTYFYNMRNKFGDK